MKIKKTWRVMKDHFTTGDVEWLRNSGLTFEIIPPETMEVSTLTGVPKSILTAPPLLDITTETGEQEVCFLLRYAEESYLLHVEELQFTETL